MIPSKGWRARHTVLLVSVFAYFGIRLVEFVLSLVFKDIKAALGISTFVLGVAVAASTITYAAAQLPSGALGDRFGHRSVILASIVLTGAASVMLAVSPSGIIIVLGMGLIGLVGGAYYSPATALLTDQFDEPGRAIGIHRIGAQAVGFTGPVVGALGAIYGWRLLLVGTGVLTVPIFAAFWGAVRPMPSKTKTHSLSEHFKPAAVWEILTRPPIATTTVVAMFAQFADTATFSFLPLLLREYHGLDIELASGLFTIYFISVAISQPVSGWLSDFTDRDAVTVGTLCAALTGFLLLLVRPAFPFIIAGVVTIGIGMGWGPPVQAKFMDHLADTERGQGFGSVRSVYIGFAALNGIVIGAAETIWGWKPAIAILVGSLIVPVLVITWLRIPFLESYRRANWW